MMKALIGKISAVDADLVMSKTKLRFKDASKFITPDALIIHEQQLISDERLFDACQREYNRVLYDPVVRYVPKDIIDAFKGQNVVVLDYDVSESKIILGTIPEFARKKLVNDYYTLEVKLIPIYRYVELYYKQYGDPDFLAELPTIDKWDFIVSEAIALGASDITVTNMKSGAQVYYNARKTKVHSERKINPEDVELIAKLLASKGKATIADDTAKPRYFSIDINKQNRGRVVINRTYYGLLMTIRILPNSILTKTLEDLNLKASTCEFIRETMLSSEKGLRLFIGETMSGKNTSILTALLELVKQDRYKIVSLEQPVEILVDGIEQINAETDEEFELNADSLLRQNPDIVYFTEMTARTANSILKQSQTSKAVFSTVHANSIAEVLFRLQDLTGYPIDRIILTLHSCVFQELVRNDKQDKVYPFTRCIYFDEDLKMQLYGKSVAEIVGILRGIETRWQ